MKYLLYSAEDFITDPYFQEWIAGTDEATATFWEEWRRDHPEKQVEIDEAAHFLRQLQFRTADLSSEDFRELWQDILAHRDTPQYRLKQPLRRWMGAAAALLLLSFGALFFLNDRVWSRDTLVQTDYSDTREVVLPDGSVAILNANSRLRYADSWDEDEVRRVELEGEAFFSVNHTANHQKFVVQSGELLIEVLGTQFNVNNRRGNNKVVLEEGRVRLNLENLAPTENASRKEHPSLIMEPGEMVQVSSSADVSRRIVNPEVYSSWTKNKLIFDNSSLEDIIRMIEDNYGYAVYTKDLDVRELRFSGELRSTEPELLLAYLSEAFDLQVETTDRKIILAPNDTSD